MKTLLSTIIFAMLSVALFYYTKESWGVLEFPESATSSDLIIIPIAFIEYCLISGFFISLTACFKKGFHNLKVTGERGLITGLIGGLITGLIITLIYGLIIALIDGLITGLITGLIIGLITGLITGLIAGLIEESNKQSEKL